MVMRICFSSIFHRAALLLMACFVIFFLCETAVAEDLSPSDNNGHKWRIAYYQGGPISFYTNLQKELIKQLRAQGWIENAPIPEESLSAEAPYWDWLSHSVKSNYLEFLPENGYSASWNGELRKKLRAELLAKLQAGEIDLLIAMGTWAGEDFVNSEHSVPTLVMSTSSFEKTGLIASVDDSGLDHVSVYLDPSFTERQLRMFHRVTGFKSLGVAYENTVEGLQYSSMETLERLAVNRGFTLNLCEVLDTTEDRVASRTSCLSCYRQLAKSSDAIFITALLCADEEIETLSSLFKDEQVLSYSMYGSDHVEKGIFLGGSSEAGYEFNGVTNARKMIQVLKGMKARDLPQVVNVPLFISINAETARVLKFKVPLSIYRIARDVYEQ